MPEVRNVQDKTTGKIAMTGRVSDSQINTHSPGRFESLTSPGRARCLG